MSLLIIVLAKILSLVRAVVHSWIVSRSKLYFSVLFQGQRPLWLHHHLVWLWIPIPFCHSLIFLVLKCALAHFPPLFTTYDDVLVPLFWLVHFVGKLWSYHWGQPWICLIRWHPWMCCLFKNCCQLIFCFHCDVKMNGNGFIGVESLSTAVNPPAALVDLYADDKYSIRTFVGKIDCITDPFFMRFSCIYFPAPVMFSH